MIELQIKVFEFISKYSFQNILSDNPIGINEKFLNLHYEVFKFIPTCNGCAKMIHNYNNLKKYSEMEDIKASSRFKLKNGFQIYARSFGAVIMNTNLTDEIAFNLIIESSSNADHFIEKPNGWEREVELMKNFKGVVVTNVTEVTEEGPVEALKEITEESQTGKRSKRK